MARDPVAPGNRIASIDGLRGMALIGILLINIFSFGAMMDWPQPFGAPSLADPSWRVWVAEHVLFEGAMRGLFSMLFGAGMLLFLRETRDDADRGGRTGLFVKRSAWLMLFGIVNGTLLLWPGDILLTYGVAAFLILPFARASVRTLLIAGGATLVGLSVAAVFLFSGFEAEILTRANPYFLEEQAARLGGYFDTLAFMSLTTWTWTFDVIFIWWVVEAAAFMLLGMALLRLDILNGKAPTRTYALMAAIGFGIALPLNIAETWAMWRNLGAATPWTELTSQLGRTAQTLGYIGLFHLVWRALPAGTLAPLAALGRMALTGYLGQSVICAVIFSGFGLGLWGQLSWPQLWLLIIPIAAVQIAFAMLWFKAFRFGPVEWLWRGLTYGQLQPMRRAVA